MLLTFLCEYSKILNYACDTHHLSAGWCCSGFSFHSVKEVKETFLLYVRNIGLCLKYSNHPGQNGTLLI